MQQEILNRTLKLIEEVYDESMYGENDIYRIKDLIHSVDTNHWKSKQWLVDEFYKLYKHDLIIYKYSLVINHGLSFFTKSNIIRFSVSPNTPTLKPIKI